MKHKILGFLAISFLVLISMTNSVSADPCCIAPYVDDYETIQFVANEQDCSGSYIFVEDCGDSATSTLNEEIYQTGYCCNDQGLAETFGAPSEDAVFVTYCEEAGYTPQQTQCDGSTPQENYYDIYGQVTFQNQGEPIGVAGVTLQANFLEGTTNESGFYNITGIPAVQSGLNDLSVLFTNPLVIGSSSYTCDPYPTQTISVTQDTRYDVELTCTLYSDCDAQWEVGPWGDCVPYANQWVKFRTVESSGDCTPLTPQPTTINFTGCEGVISWKDCNNGELDADEQCDVHPGDGTIQFRGLDGQLQNNPLECSEFGSYHEGQTINCTSVCTYDVSNCVPYCDGTCDGPWECDQCPTDCEDAYDICGDTCDDEKPIFLQGYTPNSHNILDFWKEYPSTDESYVKYKEGTNDVFLHWGLNPECNHNVLAFNIYMVDNASGEIHKKQSAGSAARLATISNALEPEKTYCYNVCLLTQDGSSENCAYNKSATSSWPCFDVGGSYCMDPDHSQGQNCVIKNGLEGPFGCIDEQTQQTNHSLIGTNCDENQVCVETQGFASSGAECRAKGECFMCNGFFGMYAAHTLTSQIYGETATFSCDNFLTQDSYQGLCYKDTTLTSREIFKECNNVSSCYDYKTQQACEQDACNRFTNESTNENTCEWNPVDSIAGKELNIGVCKPKEKDLENCFLCDTDSPLGFCTQEMCTAYGDCYFKEVQYHRQDNGLPLEESVFAQTNTQKEEADPFLSTCIPKKEMACSYYQTQEDCEGGQAVQIDTYFNSTDPDALALFGTNQQIQSSNDVFNLGDCVWNDNESDTLGYGCNKNSDGVFKRVPSQDYQTDDCFALQSAQDLPCSIDTTPPETTILFRNETQQDQYLSTTGSYLSVYGLNELSTIPMSVNDTLYPTEDLETFYTFIPLKKCEPIGCVPTINCADCDTLTKQQECYQAGCELYPQHKSLSPTTIVPKFTDGFLQEITGYGEHLFMYFSKDPAQNLEVLHTKRIFIDNRSPQFTQPFNYTVLSFKEAEDTYASNLTITFSVDEPALCSGTLFLGAKNHPIGDFVRSGTEFETEYPYLPDGYYVFDLTCEDEYTNSFSKTYDIVIEGDASITNPRPRGEVFSNENNVVLSIESANEAECRLDFEERDYANSRIEFSSQTPIPGSNRFTHTIAFSDIDPSYVRSGNTHSYFTSCNFSNGTITQRVPGDVVSFTIDTIPPVTSLYDIEGNEEVLLTEWKKERTILLVCNDSNQYTPIVNHGCGQINYCIGECQDLNESQPLVSYCEDGYVQSETEESTVLLSQLQESDHAEKCIYYYSTDNGGHTEELQRENLRLRDTDFADPHFIILD